MLGSNDRHHDRLNRTLTLVIELQLLTFSLYAVLIYWMQSAVISSYWSKSQLNEFKRVNFYYIYSFYTD